MGALLGGGSSLGIRKEGSRDGYPPLFLGGPFAGNSKGLLQKGAVGNGRSSL
jgi:hypothetical protein